MEHVSIEYRIAVTLKTVYDNVIPPTLAFSGSIGRLLAGLRLDHTKDFTNRTSCIDIPNCGTGFIMKIMLLCKSSIMLNAIDWRNESTWCHELNHRAQTIYALWIRNNNNPTVNDMRRNEPILTAPLNIVISDLRDHTTAATPTATQFPGLCRISDQLAAG